MTKRLRNDTVLETFCFALMTDVFEMSQLLKYERRSVVIAPTVSLFLLLSQLCGRHVPSLSCFCKSFRFGISCEHNSNNVNFAELS